MKRAFTKVEIRSTDSDNLQEHVKPILYNVTELERELDKELGMPFDMDHNESVEMQHNDEEASTSILRIPST